MVKSKDVENHIYKYKDQEIIMTVKRFISFLLTVAMMVLLVGCSSTDGNTDKSESIKSETSENVSLFA